LLKAGLDLRRGIWDAAPQISLGGLPKVWRSPPVWSPWWSGLSCS